ncbi:hypothetical protein ACWD6N_03690 [Micromonospora sp. NPDC005163]
MTGLPIHDGGRGDLHCPDCWTPPGQTHELSCPKVSPSQAWAYLDEVRAERERRDRRDRRMAVAGRWVAFVAVLLAAALVWGWAR